MGYVTNDPKKGDEQQPGGSGLVMDLGLMACPQCRREVPSWLQECSDCGVQAVPRTSLGSVLPDIPAHLLVDDDGADEDGADDDGALDHTVSVPAPAVDDGDVALATWFLGLSVDERVDAWHGWLRLADEAELLG